MKTPDGIAIYRSANTYFPPSPELADFNLDAEIGLGLLTRMVGPEIPNDAEAVIAVGQVDFLLSQEDEPEGNEGARVEEYYSILMEDGPDPATRDADWRSLKRAILDLSSPTPEEPEHVCIDLEPAHTLAAVVVWRSPTEGAIIATYRHPHIPEHQACMTLKQLLVHIETEDAHAAALRTATSPEPLLD